MGIEDLKRWHWIAIGLLVGLALSYVWTGVEPNLRNAGADQFLRFVQQVDPESQQPIVQDIVIHPAETDFEGKQVHPVTYRVWMKARDGSRKQRIAQKFYAEVPFVPPGMRREEVDPSTSIASYLDQLKNRHEFIRYRHAWWNRPGIMIALWTTGGALVIGLLWPIALGGLIGAGLGRKREAKDEYDLNRFASGLEPATTKPAPPAVTAEDQDRLREMTEKLESQIGTFGAAQPAGSTDVPATGTSPRKLDGGPLEAAPPNAGQSPDDEEIEVKGEYYPVLIHHKKKHDDPAQEHAN